MAITLIPKRTAAAISGPVPCNNLGSGPVGQVFVPGTLYCTGMDDDVDDPITVHIASPEDVAGVAGEPLSIAGAEITLTQGQNNYKVTSCIVLRVSKPVTAGAVGVYFSEQGNP